MSWNPFVRFPRSSLALAALSAAAAFAAATRLSVRTDARVLLEADRHRLAVLEKVERLMGGEEIVVAGVERGDLFSNSGLAAVREATAAFAGLPEVVEVKSLTSSYKPVRQGWRFEMVPLVPNKPLSRNELEELRRFCLSHPLIRGALVAEDGRGALLTAAFDRRRTTPARICAATEKALKQLRERGLRVWAGSLSLAEEELRRIGLRDLRRIGAVGILLAAALCLAAAPSWRLWAAGLAAGAIGAGWTLGAAAVLGMRPGLFAAWVLPLLGAAATALLIHLLTAWRLAVRTAETPEAAWAETMRMVWRPSLFSVLTTSAGLLSLLAGESEQMRQFGLAGGLGVWALWAGAFGPGAAALQLWAGPKREGSGGWAAAWRESGGRPAAPAREPGGSSLWTFFAAGLTRRRKTVLAIAAALTAAALPGLGRLGTDVRLTRMLPDGSRTKEAIRTLDRRYGGINAIRLSFDAGRDGGVQDPGFLRFLDELGRQAAGLPGVTAAYSYASVMAMANQMWEGGGREALRVPDNPLLIRLFSAALQAYGGPYAQILADKRLRRARLVVRTRDMPGPRLLALVRRLAQIARKEAPKGVMVLAEEGLHSLAETNRRLVRSQIESLGLGLGAIGLCCFLIWRPAESAGILLSALAPVLVVGGLAGWAGFSLNAVTVMLAAPVLGVAIDNAAHLVEEGRRRGASGGWSAETLGAALRVKGRPILWTAAVLAGGFATLSLSAFPAAREFGLLGAACLGAAPLWATVVLPCWLAFCCGRGGGRR